MYTTISSKVSVECVIQRSRFIGYAFPTKTRIAAKEGISQCNEAHASATHCCWAYRTGYPDRVEEYYSDAGEPSGSAGKPIHNAILHAELENITVVVVRYFGGVKLGIRGLIDAYRETAEAAISAASQVKKAPCVTVRMSLPYPIYDTLAHRIRSVGGHITTPSYGRDVSFAAEIPRSSATTLVDAARAAGATIHTDISG